MVELDAVGCTSLIGADAAEGRRVLLRVDELSVELGTVGCRVVSGKPLDGASTWLLDSKYSLVEDVNTDELEAVGWMMLSRIGIPADGCVDEDAVDCPKSPPRNPRDDSRVELVSLSVLATYSLLEEIVEELGSDNVGWTGLLGTLPAETTLDVVDSISASDWVSSLIADDDASEELYTEEVASVFVIVMVCVPVSPSNVGSMTVVCSVWPGFEKGLSALKLERKGAQSKYGTSEGSALAVSENVSEDDDGTSDVVVVLENWRLAGRKGWNPGRSCNSRAGAASAVVKGPWADMTARAAAHAAEEVLMLEY
jgi:hypothetical protein